MAFNRENFTDEEKEAIISHALEIDEGRIVLAQAFANTIPSYIETGRKLLKMDEIMKEEIPDPIDSRFDILDL